MTAAQKATRRLWTDRCNITVYENVVNAATGVTEQTEITAGKDIPCRLSFDSSPPTGDMRGAPVPIQSVTLFIGIEVEIPPGSKLEVTRKGITTAYAQSGKATVYEILANKEIKLKLWEQTA